MKLYEPIDLWPGRDIIAWARDQQWPRDQHCQLELNYGARVTWPISPSVMRLINGWVWARGMTVHNIYSFIRRGSAVGPDDIHVDQQQGRLCSVSLVIPCEGAGPMIWYEGQYQLVEHDHPQGTRYSRIKWLEKPRELERVELTGPTLCRVDIPHTALCVGDQPRVTVTVRFGGNPDFLTVCDAIK
jgi:hypothetical protein